MFDQECIKDAINRQYGIGGYCKNDVIVTEDLLTRFGKIKEEKEMANRITLIGSIKHSGEAMMEIYNKLTLRGSIVNLPYMGIIPEDADDDAIERLHELHRVKMKMADFVIIVDQNGYVGKDTQAEIKWCVSQGKQIIYASDLNMTQPAKSKK